MNNFKESIRNPIIAKNVVDSTLESRFNVYMSQLCYLNVNIPTLDLPKNFVLNENSYDTKNQYKTIATNGEVYSLCSDSVVALINQAKSKIQNDVRLFTTKEVLNFSQEDDINNKIESSAVIYKPIANEEVVDFVADIYKFLKENLNSPVNVEVSNTNVLQNILNHYTGKVETREKLQKVLNGEVESEEESQALQIIKSLEDFKGGNSEVINPMAERINIKESIDSLIGIFDYCAALEIYGLKENIQVNPFFIGENEYDNGLVIRFTSSEKTVATIGTIRLIDDSYAVYAKLNTDNCSELLVNKEQIVACVIIVTKTKEAMARGFKLRDIYNKSGCTVKTIYDDGSDLNDIVHRYQKSDIIFVSANGDAQFISKMDE